MSSIIVKKYNGTSYTELTPKESINSDTVDNYHASELINKATIESINYADTLVRKLYSGDLVNLSFSTVFSLTQESTGQYRLYNVGDNWVSNVILNSLNDKKLIQIQPKTLVSCVESSSKKTSVYASWYVTLNSEEIKYSSNTLTTSEFAGGFSFPTINLVDLFNRVITKEDTLTISCKVESQNSWSSTYYYTSSLPSSPTIVSGSVRMVLK